MSNDDLLVADLIIAVKEKEHRPLMRKCFPSWEAHVRYWNTYDQDGASSDEVLPMLVAEIDHVISDMNTMIHITSHQPPAYACNDIAADAEKVWQPRHLGRM